MASVLPREIAYGKQNSLPPNTTQINQVIAPANGTEFAAGSMVDFQLPATGFMVPSSMYLRYRLKMTVGGTTVDMRGTPAFTPFAKSEVLIGSTSAEQISSYNMIANILVNTKMNAAQKLGLGPVFGYSGSVANEETGTIVELDGRQFAVGAVDLPLACGLNNILANCDHLVPLQFMDQVRLQLTLDAQNNMFNALTGNATIANFKIEGVELVYDQITFGADFDPVIMSLADEAGNITIKSQSYSAASQTLNSGSGVVEMTFNQRYSSIKSLIANFAEGGTSQKNGWSGSIDPTGGEGDIVYTVNGISHPQRPLSYKQSAGQFQELANCWSPASDVLVGANLSITNEEWEHKDGDATDRTAPGKRWIGVNVEKLSTNGALLTGISSNTTPITIRLNMGPTASADDHLTTLITCHDALLIINVPTKSAYVRQ